MNEFIQLFPELILTVGATIVLLLGALKADLAMREFLRWISVLTVGLAATALSLHGPELAPTLSHGWLAVTNLNHVLSLVFLGVLIWLIVGTEGPDKDSGEWFSLLLYSGVGLLVLSRSGNLAALFLGIEVFSLAVYVLIGFAFGRKHTLRAASLYLVLAGFASAFIAFGSALIYAQYGTLSLNAIQAGATAGPLGSLAMLGFTLFLVGIGFKLSLVPFHMWAPDVYESSPGAVAGLLASAGKGAVLAAMLPLFFLTKTHTILFEVLIVLSVVVGNLLGLREVRVKRILAFSSIAHMGYVMIAFLAGPTGGSISGHESIVIYVTAYALAVLGAFATLSLLEGNTGPLTLRDLRGVARKSPALAYCLVVFIVSMIGLPPTVGFIAKLNVFLSGVASGHQVLVLVALLGSAIGAFYYLRIIIHLLALPGDVSEVRVRTAPLQQAVLIATAVAVVVFGCFPDTLASWLRLI